MKGKRRGRFPHPFHHLTHECRRWLLGFPLRLKRAKSLYHHLFLLVDWRTTAVPTFSLIFCISLESKYGRDTFSYEWVVLYLRFNWLTRCGLSTSSLSFPWYLVCASRWNICWIKNNLFDLHSCEPSHFHHFAFMWALMRKVHSNFKIGSFFYISHPVNVHKLLVEIPIDNRITLSIIINEYW